MKRILILIILCLGIANKTSAQNYSVSTNLMDYVNLGTINGEASLALSRHFTGNATVRINPWTFHSGDAGKQMQNRHQTFAAGLRYWPWHVYSGWWVSGMAQYQEYNRGGIISPSTEEGDAFGLSIAGGYSLMIHENLNLDFGLGAWGGKKTYITYACPNCGRITDKGSKWFVMPNEIIIALQYIF